MKDVYCVLSLHPTYTYHLMFLDPDPAVVDVEYQTIEELSLKHSELKELFS